MTGHRQLDADQQGDIERKARGFLEGLRKELPATPIVVLTRLAGGADQLVACAALAAGCELACVLPLEVTAYRAAFASDAARGTFDRLLAASVVLRLPQTAAATADPERAYAEAGYYLARHSTLLLAVWDGVDSHRPGSVGDLVRRRDASWLGPADPTICQLRVRRGTTRTARPDADAPLPSPRAAIAACGWRQAEQFNAAASRTPPDPARTPEPFAAVPDERVADVAAVWRAAGARAAEVRSGLRRGKALLQSIAFLAAIAFAVFLKFGAGPWVLWVYLGLLASAVTVRLMIRRQALHRRYLEYRCLAEGLRVALFWRIAGAFDHGTADSPVARLMGGPEAALGWIGSAITALDGWLGRRPLPEDFDGCAFAAAHWLGAEAGGDPHAQIPYYRAAAARLRRLAARVDQLINVTLITGIVSAALLAVLPASWLEHAAPVLTAVMGFMPLVSGSASAAVDVPAEQEMARQYEYMARLFANAARRLAAAQSDEERRQILREAGTAALAEQRIWHAVFGQRAPAGRGRA